MTTYDEVKAYHERRPFQPFVIRMSDGRLHTVDRPEFLMQSRDRQTVCYTTDVDCEVRLDVANMTSIEAVAPNTPWHGRDARATPTTRPATPADVPLILSFIRALADYERLSHAAVATEELLRSHLFGPRPAAEVLIGELDGRPVGFALFFQNFSTFLARPGIYLEDLFVLPEARGSGVGKALLTGVARLAVQRGAGRLEWSVLDWNAPAIGFYRKLGAVPMDEWTIMRVTGEALQQLGGG